MVTKNYPFLIEKIKLARHIYFVLHGEKLKQTDIIPELDITASQLSRLETKLSASLHLFLSLLWFYEKHIGIPPAFFFSPLLGFADRPTLITIFGSEPKHSTNFHFTVHEYLHIDPEGNQTHINLKTELYFRIQFTK